MAGGTLEAGSSAVNSGTVTTTTLAPVVPSGVQPGDTILIWCSSAVISVTFSAPSFTAQTATTGGAGSGTIGLLSYTYTGAEGWTPGTTTITVTTSSTAEWCAAICAVSGQFDPALSGSGTINLTASTTITVPGVTTTVAGDLLVWFGEALTPATGVAVSTISPPAGFTTQIAQNNSAKTGSFRNTGVLMATAPAGAAGATGNENGSLNAAQTNGGVVVSFQGNPGGAPAALVVPQAAVMQAANW